MESKQNQLDNVVRTVQEACGILGVCHRTYYNALEKGLLPEPEIAWAGKKYFSRSQLEDVKLNKRRGPAPKKKMI